MKSLQTFLSFSLVFMIVLLQNSFGEQYSIIIFNDIKGQLQEFNMTNGTLTPCGFDQNCPGGLRKIVQRIDELRGENSSSTFVLAPGNLVGGESGWLSILDWNKYGQLLDEDHYKLDVTSLGMNDFGAGLERTVMYMNSTGKTKFVLSNVDCKGVSGIEETFCDRLVKGVHPLVGGTIGVVGFINPDVKQLSSPGKLSFIDVISSLKSAIQSDNNSHSTYIAMGDGTLDLAKQILREVPKIKLVIYGRAFGSSKNMSAQFPEQLGGGFIATAGNYGTSVGKIDFSVSSSGDIIISPTGSKLYPTTNGRTPALSNTSKTYEIFENAAKASARNVIGSTHFELIGGDVCWRQECNLGNLVTDAMVHCVLSAAHDGNVSIPRNQPIFSLWHSGALFKDVIQSGANISSLDIHKWLPFHNRVYLTTITGSNLLTVFQESAKGITAKDNPNVKDWGQFLQVSNGMEVYYSTSDGKVEVRVLHYEENSHPVMKPLDKNATYNLVVPSFIVEGRNVYGTAKEFWKDQRNIDFDDNCVQRYVEGIKRLAIGFEERIWIDSYPGKCTETWTTGTNTAVTVVITIVVTLILVGVVYAAYFYVVPSITGRRPDGFNNF